MVSYKKLVSVYLREELYQTLMAYQEQQGFEEISETIAQILAQFFQKDGKLKRYATVDQLEAVERKVTYLSQQVTQLSQVIANSASKEAATTAIGNEFTPPAKTTQQASNSFVSTNLEEDEEEEPYEILYDFLEPENPPSPSEQQ